MKQSNVDDAKNRPIPRGRIQLPPRIPATPEELARRRALFDEIDRIRESIGPIDISVDDLIDADFYDLASDSE